MERKIGKIIISVFLTLICSFLLLLCCFLIFKKNVYIVYVENSEICNELEKVWNKSGDYPFVLKNEIIPKDKKNFFQKLFENQQYVVGKISLEKDFAFNPRGTANNQVVFKIQEELYIPSVEMDFSSFKSDEYVKLAPDFSVSFSKISEMPENRRGIKVENQYATEKGYVFTENTYLVCDFYYEDFRELILDFVNLCLKDEDCNINLEKEKIGESPLFVAGVGDLMVGRGVQEILIYKDEGLTEVFADTLPVLQNSDFTIGNLEGAITYSKDILEKTYNFKFDKKVLSPLKKAGFDYFMLTNNHIFDYGLKGFLDSISALKESGIATSGVGKTYEEASEFYITEIKNQSLAIISIGDYPTERSGFDGSEYAATETEAGLLWKNDEIYEDIKALKEEGMLIIANVHTGNEYMFSVNELQRDFAEKLIDAGVSLVLESHAHVLQPIEWYNGGIIAYGLGNFVFPGMEEMYGATESLILRVGFVDGQPIYIEPYPCEIDGTQVRLK